MGGHKKNGRGKKYVTPERKGRQQPISPRGGQRQGETTPPGAEPQHAALRGKTTGAKRERATGKIDIRSKTTKTAERQRRRGGFPYSTSAAETRETRKTTEKREKREKGTTNQKKAHTTEEKGKERAHEERRRAENRMTEAREGRTEASRAQGNETTRETKEQQTRPTTTTEAAESDRKR